MGLLEAGPGIVACEGELVGRASCEDFAVALDLLRTSNVDAPLVDLSRVSCISRRGVGLLVALRLDVDGQGRRLGLLASDRVWSVLERVGVAYVFPEKARGAPRASAGFVGARRWPCAGRREAQ
jgi:anti-anti-sigma regulatory factor